jgi:hypothetical protein
VKWSDAVNEACPHCAADLRGSEIPVEWRASYAPGATHYSRMMGVEVQGAYDGVLYWQCPDCGGRWHRWAEGTRLHEVAKQYVERTNANTETP